MAGFGIVEAAQRARGWAPHLETVGQRLVLAGLVVYTGADSVADPSVGQLSEFTGFTRRAIPRILTELEELGVIGALSERSGGRGRATRWSLKPCPVGQGLDTETMTGESGLVGETMTGERETLTGEGINPDPIRSASESSEISEKSEQFQKMKELRLAGASFNDIVRQLVEAKQLDAVAVFEGRATA